MAVVWMYFTTSLWPIKYILIFFLLLLGCCCLLECYNRLGVDSSFGHTLFSASSSANLSLPGYGRLHSGLGTGAWCAETQDANQYLQVWDNIW